MPVITPLAARGNVVHKQAKNILAVVWKDKREVSLLSTIHNLPVVESVNRDPVTSQPIMNYNIQSARKVTASKDRRGNFPHKL